MISDFHKPDDLEGVRWRTTRLGLRLANNWIGLRVFLLFFGLWCLIGLALCLVLIPFAVAGKVEVFSKALEPGGYVWICTTYCIHCRSNLGREVVLEAPLVLDSGAVRREVPRTCFDGRKVDSAFRTWLHLVSG